MKCGVLFSGGKDSVYASYIAKNEGYELSCLISIFSKNEESYMFHTPSIEKVKLQAEKMKIPLLIQETNGKKEEELIDLEIAIKNAIGKYGIECIITGAIQSVYQASRVQKICNKLNIECFNPLWQKDETEYLEELIRDKFKVIVTAVAAYPLDRSWIGREIDSKYLEEVKELNEKYKIHVAGEGGEFETFVLDCPLFSEPLKVKEEKVLGEDHAWRMEVEVE
jgi:diphthine-ammonia ligase